MKNKFHSIFYKKCAVCKKRKKSVKEIHIAPFCWVYVCDECKYKYSSKGKLKQKLDKL